EHGRPGWTAWQGWQGILFCLRLLACEGSEVRCARAAQSSQPPHGTIRAAAHVNWFGSLLCGAEATVCDEGGFEMARLLVEAVSSEGGFMDDPWAAGVGVSVSRADDGTPVTGLSKENFRVASTEGWVDWAEYVHEMKWETADIEPSGCYDVGIYKTPPQG